MRFPVIKWSILLLTPVLVSPLLLVDITYAPASRCAAVVLLMAVYWLVVQLSSRSLYNNSPWNSQDMWGSPTASHLTSSNSSLSTSRNTLYQWHGSCLYESKLNVEPRKDAWSLKLLGHANALHWQPHYRPGCWGVWSAQATGTESADDVRHLPLLHHAGLHDLDCLPVHVDQQRRHHSHDDAHPWGM